MSLQRHKWPFLDFSNNRRQSRVNCQIVVINIFKIPAILLNSAIYTTLCYIAPCYIIKYLSNQVTIGILDTQKLDSSAYRKVEVSVIQMVRSSDILGIMCLPKNQSYNSSFRMDLGIILAAIQNPDYCVQYPDGKNILFRN